MGFIFGAVAVLALLECIAQGLWLPTYFRRGLPVYRRRMVCAAGPRMAALEGPLEEESKGRIGPPIAFRALSDEELAFRERLAAGRLFSYTPVMHGLARLDTLDRTVTVTGYLNWYVLAFLGLWYSFNAFWGRPPQADWLGWYGIPILILGIIYLVQFLVYARVARRIGERCAGV